MKIGFLIPAMYSLGSPGNGILAQARYQAESLEALGCEVVRLNPWEWMNIKELDVLQFFQGGLSLYMVERLREHLGKGILVFAPIIDSNQSNFSYSIAAKLGQMSPRLHTIPGEYAQQAQGSDLILCRSTHEKMRVTYGLGVDPKKIRIVLNGAALSTKIRTNIHEVREKYRIPEEFIFHVSTYTQERKNVIRLVKAAKELGYPIVIAGTRGTGVIYDTLERIARDDDKIKLLGFLEKAELDALYACCRVFCLPSFHEGTGLVALDAAAHGANIVITKYGGPPDYFENYAEYVDPFSLESIKNGIDRAWKKPKTTNLREHIQSNLTWINSGKSLLDAYKEFLHRI